MKQEATGNKRRQAKVQEQRTNGKGKGEKEPTKEK
jgi:hypothetical protein